MNTFSKHTLIGTLALLSSVAARAQNTNVAVNDNGAAANANALLDVSFGNPALPKGFLIPRVTQLPGTPPLPAAASGLTVYMTNSAPPGFWYWNSTTNAWVQMYQPSQPWTINGNPFIIPGTGPGQNFLGTTDDMSLAFRTNGSLGIANERMRVYEAAGASPLDGNVGIGTTTPQEKLDVFGAILFTGTSATTSAGTIRYNSVLGYHEGNQGGGAGAWKKLENDYTETFGVAFSQQGPVNCTATSAVIPPWFSGVPPTPGSPAPGPTSNSWDINPFRNTTTNTRARHQWLFRRNELNVELAQLGPPSSNYSVQGICPNVSSISSLDFYVTIAGVAPRSYTSYMLKIRHTPANVLSGTAFDGNPDPAERWVCSTTPTAMPITTTGWKNFGPLQGPLGVQPFIWNGVDNVIVELCFGTTSALGGATEPTVWCSPLVGYVCNASREGPLIGPGSTSCSNNALPCNAVTGCGMDFSCGLVATPNPQVRPIVRFNGTSLATAGPFFSGTGKYVTFNGGMMIEGTPGWAATPAIAGACTRPFHGNGRITAQNGVWDDQLRLNDHVFDRWFDGRVAPEDAAQYGAQRTLDVGEMVNYVERERHLPTMKGRSEWEQNGGFGLGDLANQLWATTETQALYAVQLNDRIASLDALAADGPLTPAEAADIMVLVQGMQGLTEAQKQALAASCQARVTNAATR